MTRSRRLCAAAAALAATALAATSAQAIVLYNSASVGYAVGYTVIGGPSGSGAGGFAADTFTLTHAAVVNQVVFDSWTLPGDKVTDVGWAILDAGGVPVSNILAQGFADVTSTHYVQNLYGYDINFDSFTFTGLSLAAGTYWLELGNADTDTPGDGVGWDETVSASQFYANDVNITHPNTFAILGPTPERGPGGDGGGLPTSGGGVPEPDAWALMILGFGGVGAVLRSTRRRAAALA